MIGRVAAHNVHHELSKTGHIGDVYSLENQIMQSMEKLKTI